MSTTVTSARTAPCSCNHAASELEIWSIGGPAGARNCLESRKPGIEKRHPVNPSIANAQVARSEVYAIEGEWFKGRLDAQSSYLRTSQSPDCLSTAVPVRWFPWASYAAITLATRCSRSI